jgi:putative membrane protein
MEYLIFRTVAVLLASYVTGVGVPITLSFSTLWVALLVALVLAVINHTIKPLLNIVLIPIQFVTLGLVSFLVNGGIIVFASNVVTGFSIPSLLMGIWFSIVLAVVNWVLHVFE